MKILTETDLQRKVPSIFAECAASDMSERYAFIPTIACVRALQESGFFPVDAQESRVRDPNNRAHTKHLLRFRREDAAQVGDSIPEIVLINSHNGACSYQMRAGIFRLVCSNGLIVGNTLFEHRIRHQGDVINKVVEAAQDIIEVVPEVLEISNEWKQIRVSEEQQKAYAGAAALLKWDKEELPFDPSNLLYRRRLQDQDNNVWTTFNAVQENVMKGGLRYYNPKTRTRQRTRAVGSVNENARLNTALWQLTEKMAEILN